MTVECLLGRRMCACTYIVNEKVSAVVGGTIQKE